MTATMTAEAGTTQPEVTIERFLEALWGIRLGESRPRLQPAIAPYTFEDGVGEWLYRIWGIGDQRHAP